MTGADHWDERREEKEDNGHEKKMENDSGQEEEERSGYSERQGSEQRKLGHALKAMQIR